MTHPTTIRELLRAGADDAVALSAPGVPGLLGAPNVHSARRYCGGGRLPAFAVSAATSAASIVFNTNGNP